MQSTKQEGVKFCENYYPRSSHSQTFDRVFSKKKETQEFLHLKEIQKYQRKSKSSGKESRRLN